MPISPGQTAFVIGSNEFIGSAPIQLSSAVIGNITNPATTIGNTIIINGLTITLTGTTLTSVINDITTAAPPNITASNSSNRLKLVSANRTTNIKLDGTALPSLGLSATTITPTDVLEINFTVVSLTGTSTTTLSQVITDITTASISGITATNSSNKLKIADSSGSSMKIFGNFLTVVGISSGLYVPQVVTNERFNGLSSSINQIFGSGAPLYGSYGYGGTSLNVPLSSLPTKSDGAINLNVDWLNLRNALSDIALHQNTTLEDSLPDIASLEIGDVIRAFEDQEPINNPFGELDSIQNSSLLNGKRLNVNPANQVVSTKLVSTRTTSWNNTVRHQFRLEFTNSDDARYFFNTGGQIDISATRTGGISSLQNTSWTNLLSGATCNFNADHYYNLSSTYQVIKRINATGTYGINEWRVEARYDDVTPDPTSHGAKGRLINILISFDDRRTGGDDIVTGTLTSTIQERRSSLIFDRPSPVYNQLIATSDAQISPVLTNRTFLFNGTTQTWMVPAGVTSITARLWGSGGGGASGFAGNEPPRYGGNGGGGGFIKGNISVTPGETLTIKIGGGGSGSTVLSRGGGGGGYVALYRGATLLLLAGSGGGGGGGYNGGAGGHGGPGGNITAGVAGGSSPNSFLVKGGNGGGSVSGGTGGAGLSNPGTSGSSLIGGDGGSNGVPTAGGGSAGGLNGGGSSGVSATSGGGGGSGWFGGGGGGGSNLAIGYGGGGGGGGSSYADGSITSVSSSVGSGKNPGGMSETGYIIGLGMGGQGCSTANNGFDGSSGLIYINW